MTWSPQQYTRFEDDRTRPVRDLVAAIPNPAPATAIDLGCGPGNSTEILAARYPDAGITGLDSDANMIEAARQRLPAIAFEVADIAGWLGQADVILSNAALHWLPDHDHPAAPPGVAAQPGRHARDPDARQPRGTRLPGHARRGGPGTARPGRGPARQHGDGRRLLRHPQTRLHPRRRLAHDLFPRAREHRRDRRMVQGQRAAPLSAGARRARRADFLARYRAGIAAAYPTQPDGTALLPFPRLFLVATR